MKYWKETEGRIGAGRSGIDTGPRGCRQRQQSVELGLFIDGCIHTGPRVRHRLNRCNGDGGQGGIMVCDASLELLEGAQRSGFAAGGCLLFIVRVPQVTDVPHLLVRVTQVDALHIRHCPRLRPVINLSVTTQAALFG